MTTELKALPSEYAGCVFRSRLEARIACYFDLLGIRWEYEPEGFELPSGNYAPDFLCDRSFYVEVKPDTSAFPLYEDRLRQLCQLSKKDVYYMPGIPFEDLKSLSLAKHRIGDRWLSNPAHYFTFDDSKDDWGRENRGTSVFTRYTRRGPDAFFTHYAFLQKRWGCPYYGDEYFLCEEDVEAINRARFLKFDQCGRAML